jgi:hypothetical protein
MYRSLKHYKPSWRFHYQGEIQHVNILQSYYYYVEGLSSPTNCENLNWAQLKIVSQGLIWTSSNDLWHPNL